jgi:hypothetical protein
MNVIRAIFDWGLPAVVAVATWFIVQFAAKPYLRFRALRATIQARLLTLEKSTLVPLSIYNPNRAAMIEIHNAEIDRQLRALRETGITLVAMADTEWFLTRILNALGYDLRTAGTALMSLPLILRKRDPETLLPPIDDENDKFVAILRDTLRLPQLGLLNANDK